MLSGLRRRTGRVLLPGMLFVLGMVAGVGGAIGLMRPGLHGLAGQRSEATAVPTALAPGVSPAPESASDRVARDWKVARPGRPVRIEIPKIHVRSALVRLGLQRDGSLQTPADWDTAGWYSGGTSPGEIDPIPAVIAGHVDSRSGPAVFYHLRELERGDLVVVRRSDGVVARFTVDGSKSYPKDDFPDSAVYGPVEGETETAQLRLITCTGTFDRATRRYRDDLVVFAHRTG